MLSGAARYLPRAVGVTKALQMDAPSCSVALSRAV
jgi:hypothetical protein